ncbi:MAG: PDZ domain-containing protein [Actinomycetota bacterium]
MRNSGYFRTPTVTGGEVAFVSEDDIWSVPLTGGTARRLTAGLGPTVRPAFSPDGSLIAFTSLEEHHPEVYVMPAAGGQPVRLTFLGVASTVVGWTPDAEIAFRSDTGQPFAMRRMELFSIAPGGGEPKRLPLGEAHAIAYGPNGAVLLGRNTLDPARWKRYRGGTAGRLWIDARGTGSFRRLLPGLNGNFGSPMWIGARVYFLSDHEGIGNVYSCRPDGRDMQRHTDHDEYYARFASTDGRTIVYQHAAELWRLDAASGEAARIEVDFPSPRAQRNRKFVDSERFLQGYQVHPAGHSLAVEARGKLFAMPLWEGAVREYGESAGVRYRAGQWLADGERLVVVSDAGGVEGIEVHGPAGARARLDGLDLGRVEEMAASPSKNVVALSNHRLELMLVDIDAKSVVILDRSEFEQIHHLVWSPCGDWLAYSCSTTPRTRSIRLCNIAAGTVHDVTAPEFRDFAPSFDPDGRFLAFLSLRTFDPVFDAHFFDLGFPRGARPYLVTLRSDVVSPFVSEPKGFGEDKNGNGKKNDAKKKGAKTSEPLKVDLEGIGARILAFPVPEGRYGQIACIKGKVLWTEFGSPGTLGVDWKAGDTPRGSLTAWEFATQKADKLADGVSDFVVASDGATLVYRSGTRLRALKAGEHPNDDAEQDPPSRANGWIDLARVRISVDPGAEWRQMFSEAWRLQRDNFWNERMSGVDWPRVFERYLPLVDKVATRLEFSDLIWEMQGELGTSHAYEMFGDYRRPPAYAMGYLGADLRLDEKNRWRIDRILRGDSWDEARCSPLAAPGLDVGEGATLLAINGRALDASTPPGALLVHQAGQRVELTVGDAAGRKPRTVVVKTLRDEVPLRYREWVERNRAHVHEASGGRVGYVHIPNMGPLGFSEFHRYYFSEVERDALIVDVRFNGGGNVSPLILEKLARKRLGYDVKRWGVPEPYPQDTLLGPMVCLTNEHAGSDGDIFSHCFKLMKLGPLVGTRTWGGVVGIWPRHDLVDGGFTTQPEFSFWFVDVGWSVENYGTDPDHEVDIAPQDHAAGRDPQMQKALDLIAKELKRTKPRVPKFPKGPSLALPKLPPRS